MAAQSASPAQKEKLRIAAGQPKEWKLQSQAFKGDTLIGMPGDIKSVLVRG
jgi:hypothetical protein